MDPELATTLGAILGGGFTAMLLVIGLGWKLWQSFKQVVSSTTGMGQDLRNALGSDLEQGSGVEERPEHPKGIVGALRRELSPIRIAVGELKTAQAEQGRAIAHQGERLDELADGQREQGEMIADLARNHNKVAKRVAAKSASHNIREAEQTLTNGRVPA